jgi:predicted MPP superfamily phosphohydrolase
VKRLL